MKDDAILAEAKTWQKSGRPLANALQIAEQVKAATGFAVSPLGVRHILKRELGLSFIKAKKLHPNANSARVLVQRQQYALKLLPWLE